MGWRVIGPVAVVLVDGSARYMEQGRVFTAGDNIDHLVSIGLVEVVEETEPAEPVQDPDGTSASGDPDVAAAVEAAKTDLAGKDLMELRAIAAERHVDLTGRTRKADIIDALIASTAPADPAGD